MNNKLDGYSDLLKDALVSTFDKESQLGRSFKSKVTRKRPKNFNRVLLNEIKFLRNEVDNKTIKNDHIRNSIKKLSKKTGATIGQAQKVINVYLKVYCFLSNKKEDILKELDCPLDYATHKISMSKLRGIEKYKEQQQWFKKKYIFRILADMDYDKKRLRRFKIHQK